MAWVRSNKKSSGGAFSAPTAISGQSLNRRNTTSLSYTFTEGGTFQYCVFISSNKTIELTDISIKLNNNAITPTRLTNENSNEWFYGEVTVSSGDVLSVTNNVQQGERGMQFFVLQYCDITKFLFLGLKSNNNQTFSLDYDGIFYLQSYRYGYGGTNNNFNYHIGSWNLTSIPTPNESAYYYGGTWAIQVA